MQLLEDILIIFNVTAEKQKCFTSGCREWSYRHQWHSQGEHAGAGVLPTADSVT